MDARDTCVINAGHAIAQGKGGNGGFFGHGDVGGACRYDRYSPFALLGAVSEDGDHPRVAVKMGVGRNLQQPLEDLFGRPGDKQVRAAGENALCDLEDLLDGFALAQYDFGEPESHLAVMVDAGKFYVFIRESREMFRSLVRVDAARLHLLY
jgi:hypothetical protein